MDNSMSTLQILTDDPDTIDIASVDTSLSFIDKISDKTVASSTVDSGLATLSNLLCSLKVNQNDTGES